MPALDVSPRPLATVAPVFECALIDDGTDVAWVRVTGELDIASAPRLDRVLREAELQARLVVVDLRCLSFIDSAGIHVIVRASARARDLACRLIVVRGPRAVERLFALSQASAVVEIVDLDAGAPALPALLQVALIEQVA